MRPFHEVKKEKTAQRERLGEKGTKESTELSKRGQFNSKEEKKEAISAWNASRGNGCRCC